LTFHAQLGARYVPFLRRHLRRAARMIPTPLRELSLALVNDRRMSELHLQFMNIPGPTDVLTFPLEQQRRRVTAGEIVICVPEARRRAADQRTPVEHELLLYAIHGMLHLCGFDDRTPDRYQAMHRKEDQILTQLGIGPVFSRATEVDAPHAPLRGRGRG
jgi:probable rRNA maturation factor